MATLPGVLAPSRTGKGWLVCAVDLNLRAAYGGSSRSLCTPSTACIAPRESEFLLSALTVCATTGIAASLPIASVEESRRSRNGEVELRPSLNLIALARSMTCGKSMFHGCGGTYGHFVMEQRSHR